VEGYFLDAGQFIRYSLKCRRIEKAGRVMTQLRAHRSIEDSAEFRAVHSRLDELWGPVLGHGQTPCCYALTKNHILLRALEKLLELFPRESRRRR
jgi:hypothetical protein